MDKHPSGVTHQNGGTGMLIMGKELFHGGMIRLEIDQYFPQPFGQANQSLPKLLVRFFRTNNPRLKDNQAAADRFQNAIAGYLQPRVNADDTDPFGATPISFTRDSSLYALFTGLPS